MITSKQRAQLRGMAAALNTELQIGKSGITENVVRQAEEALAARELSRAVCLITPCFRRGRRATRCVRRAAPTACRSSAANLFFSNRTKRTPRSS